MSTHFVIVGGGVAGFRAAKEIRRADTDAEITLFAEEPHPFYLRRQLGDLLAGHLSAEELVVQSRSAYRRERTNLFLATRVTRVDPAAHEVRLDSGQRIRYDRLLIATGSRAVPLAIPGGDLEGVVTLDTLEATLASEQILAAARRAVILDEGVIGLRLAEALASRGLTVTLLVPGERLWPAMLDDGAATILESLLKDEGVTLLGGTARSIVGAANRAIAVETAAGEVLGADLVVAGGVRRPAVDVVEGSGVEVPLGIRVDAALRTNVPDVFAAGDVADPFTPSAWGPDERPLCWQRAWTQGGIAAAAMLDRPSDRAADIVRIRTVLCGHDLAVIGGGHLPEAGGVEAVVVQSQAARPLPLPGETADDAGAPDHCAPTAGAARTYRRLVFNEGRLAGAILLGPADWYPAVVRLVADRAPREVVEHTLGLASQEPPADTVPQTFARHCPICAAELVVYRGTPAGSALTCRACNTKLRVRWDGKRGWLEAAR